MSVLIESFIAAGHGTTKVVSDLREQIGRSGLDPDFIFVFYGAAHDDELIAGFLRSRFPGTPFLGGTSCRGVMTDDGVGGPDSIGLLLIEDPDGSYGSASVRLGADPIGDARQALLSALDGAGSAGELPELIWIYQSPGREELVIEGIRSVVGDRCPVIGGSAADDQVVGEWRVLTSDGPMTEGLVVGALFPSGNVTFAFEGGYEPTGASGVVTRLTFSPSHEESISDGVGRHILEIDGKPAADVYNHWLGGTLPADVVDHGGNILMEAAVSPIATVAGAVSDVRRFRLIHPESISAHRGIATFAEVEAGAEIFAMRGGRDQLIQRLGRVASAAVTPLPNSVDDIAGAVVVFCAGCLLAVGDEAERVGDTAAASFGGAPFIGCFTFGEQGSIFDQNLHANLMISAVVFGR